MRFNPFTFFAASWLIVGCTPVVSEYRPDGSGRYVLVSSHKQVGTPYDDTFFRSVDECIAREESTGSPSIDHQSPKQYWRTTYSNLRSIQHFDALPSKFFKNSEEMVAYIKQKRREHGLPTYD